MVRLEIIDMKTRKAVEIADLTIEGRQQMAYEAKRLIEELEEADSD